MIRGSAPALWCDESIYGDSMEKLKLTKYETARIIGARALQISMGAPLLVDRGKLTNTIEIAKKEFESGSLPIYIKRVMPEKREVL